jgi:predicted transcriptional regulator
MKRRREFYLDEDLSGRLATMAAKPGSSKTAIMTDALRAYFDRSAASKLDERFRARLDKQSFQLARIERDQQIVAETLALLARFQFLVTTPLPGPDRAARTLAQERFKAFVEHVSCRLSTGCSFIEDVLAPKSAAERKQYHSEPLHAFASVGKKG